MKKILNKIIIILSVITLLFAYVPLFSDYIYAEESSKYLKLADDKSIYDRNKKIIIRLSDKVDEKTIKNNVFVKTQNNSFVNTKVYVMKDNPKNIVIDAPSGGYKENTRYTVYVNNISSKNGEKIKNYVKQSFMFFPGVDGKNGNKDASVDYQFKSDVIQIKDSDSIGKDIVVENEKNNSDYTVKIPKKAFKENLKNGKVIFVHPNNSQIHGFAMKVKNFKVSGNNYIIYSTLPTTEDIYSKLNINVSLSGLPSNGKENVQKGVRLFKNKDGFVDGIHLDNKYESAYSSRINNIKSSNKSDDESDLEKNIKFEINISNIKPEIHYDLKKKLEYTQTYKIENNIEINFDKSKDLIDYEKRHPIESLGASFRINPFLKINFDTAYGIEFKSDGSIEGNITFSGVNEGSLNIKTDFFNFEKDHKKVSSKNLLNVSGSGKAETSLYPYLFLEIKLSVCEIIDTVKFKVKIGIYGSLGLEINGSFEYDFDEKSEKVNGRIGADAEISVKCKFYLDPKLSINLLSDSNGKADDGYNFFDLNFKIADYKKDIVDNSYDISSGNGSSNESSDEYSDESSSGSGNESDNEYSDDEDDDNVIYYGDNADDVYRNIINNKKKYVYFIGSKDKRTLKEEEKEGNIQYAYAYVDLGENDYEYKKGLMLIRYDRTMGETPNLSKVFYYDKNSRRIIEYDDSDLADANTIGFLGYSVRNIPMTSNNGRGLYVYIVTPATEEGSWSELTRFYVDGRNKMQVRVISKKLNPIGYYSSPSGLHSIKFEKIK